MKFKRKNRSGATATEFAMVAPIIFLLVMGLMEWSRFEMIRQVSSTAAFSAARIGTLPGATSADVENRVDEILGVYSISQATRTATISANETTVNIQIPMADNSWFLKRYFGSAVIQREFTLQF